MVNAKRLRGEIVANGYSMGEFSKMLNMSRSAFYRRMKVGIFGSDEIEQMMELLDIKNPVPIFFDTDATQ